MTFLPSCISMNIILIHILFPMMCILQYHHQLVSLRFQHKKPVICSHLIPSHVTQHTLLHSTDPWSNRLLKNEDRFKLFIMAQFNMPSHWQWHLSSFSCFFITTNSPVIYRSDDHPDDATWTRNKKSPLYNSKTRSQNLQFLSCHYYHKKCS